MLSVTGKTDTHCFGNTDTHCCDNIDTHYFDTFSVPPVWHIRSKTLSINKTDTRICLTQHKVPETFKTSKLHKIFPAKRTWQNLHCEYKNVGYLGQYHKENHARWQKVNSSGAWETLSSNLHHVAIKKVPDQHARNIYMSQARVQSEGVWP